MMHFLLLFLSLTFASSPSWVCLVKNGRLQDSALSPLLIGGMVVKSLNHYEKRQRTSVLELSLQASTQQEMSSKTTDVLALASLLQKRLVSIMARESHDILVSPNFPISLSSEALYGTANGSWALDRIDQRSLPLDGLFSLVGSANGEGVTVYHADTGVFAQHPDFDYGQRASTIYSAYSNSEDNNGHGTMTAALAVGRYHGVARLAVIAALKVLDDQGNGNVASITNGFQFIADNPSLPAVLTMSWATTTYSSVLDASLQSLSALNIILVAAMGNGATNGCSTYPAAFSDVIGVGSTDQNDNMASFSNYGTCVDIYAPGVDVISASLSGGSTSSSSSGTSFSAPLAAGVIATLIQQNGSLSNAAVASILIRDSTQGIIKGLPTGSFNRLLYAKLQPSLVNITTTPGPTISSSGNTTIGMKMTMMFIIIVAYAIL